MSGVDDSPLVNHWWMWREDGELINGQWGFGDAGADAEPDWVWAEEADHDEPVVYVCERFADQVWYVSHEVRRRTFGQIVGYDDD